MTGYLTEYYRYIVKVSNSWLKIKSPILRFNYSNIFFQREAQLTTLMYGDLLKYETCMTYCIYYFKNWFT